MTPAQFKAARNKLGLTQEALARQFGVSLPTVKAWEGGANRITGPTALLMDPQRLTEWNALCRKSKRVR